MEKIRIVYVDDDLDENISKYFFQKCNEEDSLLEYDEVRFKKKDGYERLINDSLIKRANIILIDSKLFENDSVITEKFTGEEFKIILRKMLPFIEVFVITQNDDAGTYGTLKKYRTQPGLSPQEHYEKTLNTILEDAIKNIHIYRNISSRLKNNKGIEQVLIERIMNSLDGASQYDELTTNDIDSIIIAFKDLQEKINGKGL